MKVLIVDDELHIRNGLKRNIEWLSLGISQVFTAEDGEEGREICRKERPEIIISDIRMPGLSGLELAEQAVKNWGAKKVILFSGYSEFEYAKKAISIGVVDYLLKPVKLDELTKLLKKSIEEIQNEDLKAELLCRQNIRKILEEETSVSVEKVLYKSQTEYPRELLLFIVQKNCIYATEDEQADIERATAQIREWDETVRFLYRKETETVFLLEINSLADRERSRQIISTGMRKLEPYYSAGISERGLVTDIKKLYRQANEALRHRFYRKHPGCVFYEEVGKNQENIYPLLSIDKGAIQQAVTLFKTEELERIIQEHFRVLYNKKCCEQHVAVELCIAIKNAVFETMQEKGIDIAGILDKNQIMFQDQLKFSFLESYERWIKDYCSLLLLGLKDLSGKQYSTVISRAVDYIQQHYMESITLIETAEAVNKSSCYFSCIFKKEMGVNFNEYLNQVRIRKAKQLLRGQNMVVYQVAEQVGFRDYKYFIKVFKRICGCSPGEYSRGMGES